MSGRMSNEENNARQDSAAPRRRHRLRRAVIVILLLLVAIVAAGPYIASTGPVKDLIVSAINSHIHGTVQIDDLSQVEQIIWEHGAWRGITGPENFGLVKVIKPEPTLIVGPDGKISLAEALKPRKPSEEPLPELFGQITVRDGSVKLILDSGTEGDLSGLNAQFDLNTLDDIAGEFSWDSVEMYDMVLGKAAFKPTFRNERLDLSVVTISVSAVQPQPVATIPVSTVQPQKDAPAGFLRIGCKMDFSGDEPVLKMPGTLKVAENIPINQELGTDVLSRILAIFYEPKELTGQISLAVEDLNLPLGESIKHTGSGRGKLILKDVKILSNGLMTGLTNLGGLAPPNDLTSLKISDLVFEIRDGRFYYDDLTVTSAGILDMKFTGSVGFDDTLDMIVTLPVLPKQFDQIADIITLKKLRSGSGLGTLNPLSGSLDIIGNIRRVRIIGTRQEPKFGLPPVLDPLLKPKTRPAPQPTTKPAGPLLKLLGDLIKPKPSK
jgi:hypothetical protein